MDSKSMDSKRMDSKVEAVLKLRVFQHLTFFCIIPGITYREKVHAECDHSSSLLNFLNLRLHFSL